MNFTQVASEVVNWIQQNPVDTAVIGFLAVAGTVLARMKYKEHRQDRREALAVVEGVVNRPKSRRPLPPHSSVNG